MHQKVYIQKIIALLLLAVFAFSSVPKSYIHNLLADHQDYENACHHTSHTSPCLKAAGVNCHFDNLVVDVPFIYQQTEYLSRPTFFLNQLVIYPSPAVLAFATGSKDGRGPPAA